MLTGSLALAAASIPLLPDDIGYDPYSWAIWGREIAHLHLDTRDAATSVKPLPMLFDTIFAPAGTHIPGCWMYVARAAAILLFAIIFRTARRLGGVPAGAIAVAAMAASNALFGYLFLRGMSEPMAAAAMLAAVDCFLLRRYKATTGCLIAAAYLRPEAWPVLFVFLLWRAWPHSWTRRVVAFVVGAFVPFSWFLIDWFGARQFNRSAQAAQHQSQGGPLLHRYPGLATFTETWKLASGPVVVLFLVGLVASVVVWWRSGHSLDPAKLAPPVIVSLIALVWVVIDAILAQGHLATGAPRYLLPGEALACVTVGWVVVVGARWLRRRAHAGVGIGRATTSAAVVLVVALLSPWLETVGRQVHTGVNEGRQNLRDAAHLDAAIRLGGGREAIARCGAVTTSIYAVPLLAWKLDVTLDHVGISVTAPGTVVQQGTRPVVAPPTADQFQEVVDGTGTSVTPWSIYTTC